MGDPKRIRKKFKSPRQPFERDRIDTELKLVGKYGLRNMRSVWKHSTLLRHFRVNARKLLSLPEEDRDIREKELLNRLHRMGLLKKKSTLDDVLTLKVEDFLDRRLQTFVYKKGMALTPYQARQMITHGHVMVNERVTKSPGYLVKEGEGKTIQFSPHSPYSNPEHKALPDNVLEQKKEQKKKGKGKKRSRRQKK
ncbi:MAG: 30S ribosomal protein S4 [Asgard group archaeon]|nr:30S ribosomal protein S4 [Asgard group archaeon]